MRPWGVVMWYGLVCEVIFDGGRTGRNFFVVCFFRMKNNVWRTHKGSFLSQFFFTFLFSVLLVFEYVFLNWEKVKWYVHEGATDPFDWPIFLTMQYLTYILVW